MHVYIAVDTETLSPGKVPFGFLDLSVVFFGFPPLLLNYLADPMFLPRRPYFRYLCLCGVFLSAETFQYRVSCSSWSLGIEDPQFR